MTSALFRLADAPPPKVEELLAVQVFADLSRESLDWLASHMKAVDLARDELAVHTGAPADSLIVVLAGELQGETADGRGFAVQSGQVTGMLPFSRMTHYSINVRATLPTRIVALSKDHFAEMLQTIPVLQQRLVNLMADRIREVTAADQQREKMMALGRLSAGLAHELNNPAAAARRAAHNLKEAWETGRAAALELDRRDLPCDARTYLAQLELDWSQKPTPPTAIDTLERNEQEEEVVNWLEDHQVPQPWTLASSLVELGCSIPTLEQIAGRIPQPFLNHALIRLTASFSIGRLADEIESSTARISELVQAVKEYSYMDRVPQEEIDIHRGIETTLIMLRARLKEGMQLVQDYDRTLPKLYARGNELNQIWTNLIVNALDAMNGRGTLTVRTSRDRTFLCVEIIDDGPGIPPEAQSHIFEPFFTTKGVGQGTGLGLETASRIARNHGGSITFVSQPGATRFTVRLPLDAVTPPQPPRS